MAFLAHIPAREIALGDYLPWCETVKARNRIKVPDCRDPLDRPFLELALTARADALITGDKDLLDLSETVGVPILTPAAFRVRLGHLPALDTAPQSCSISCRPTCGGQCAQQGCAMRRPRCVQ